MNKTLRELQASGDALNTFGVFARHTGETMRAFAEVFLWTIAFPAYLKAHNGFAPGSHRTSRLQKKRRDAVLRWWKEQTA